jgi:hypothetical protein
LSGDIFRQHRSDRTIVRGDSPECRRTGAAEAAERFFETHSSHPSLIGTGSWPRAFGRERSRVSVFG